MKSGSASATKQFRELAGAVVRCLPDLEPEIAQLWIEHPQTLRGLLQEALAVVGGDPPSLFLHDHRGYGWTLRKHIVTKQEITSPAQFELVPILKEEECWLDGDTLCKRAAELGAQCGQDVAEKLHALEEPVPEEWQDYTIVFPGTIWQDELGRRQVLTGKFGHHQPGIWSLKLIELHDRWSSNDRLLCFRKAQSS